MSEQVTDRSDSVNEPNVEKMKKNENSEQQISVNGSHEENSATEQADAKQEDKPEVQEKVEETKPEQTEAPVDVPETKQAEQEENEEVKETESEQIVTQEEVKETKQEQKVEETKQDETVTPEEVKETEQGEKSEETESQEEEAEETKVQESNKVEGAEGETGDGEAKTVTGEKQTDGGEGDAAKEDDTTEEDEEDEEESDEELPPGLLERPIEILKEKRERKKTTRFSYDDAPTPSSDKKKFEVPDGRGVKLINHPRVEWQLQRNKTEDLKIIHKLFFGVSGDAFSCKKNMRNFSGFPFEKDTPEFEKREEYIGRFTMDNLKWALTVCDIQNKKGKKEDLIETFLEWCLCPKPSGKDVPEKKKKKDKPKKRRSKSKKSSEKVNDSIKSDSDLSDEDDEPTPKKARTPKKSPKPKTPKSEGKKSPRKRKATGSPSKVAKVKLGSPKKGGAGADSDDSDAAPLQKKSKKPPTNAQIKKAVAKILKDANLEVITMKNVCMKVYALYPEFDLSDKKPFIKETVKSIIS